MMRTIKIEWSDRKRRADFLKFPYSLYENTPQWVPPFEFEVKNTLNRVTKNSTKQSEAVSFIVLDGSGKPSGRVTAINNQRYNSHNQSQHCFFTHFECNNDREAAECLFGSVFTWARERKLTKILGPKGFTPLDGLGLLVDGFEFAPAFGVPYNPRYYHDLMEAVGFSTMSDIVSGYVTRESSIAEKILKAAEIVKRRTGLSVGKFTKRRDLLQLIPKLCELYNKAIEGTSGNYPITETEAREMAHKLLLFADPRLIKILFHSNEPVGFLFAYPDISDAVQKHRGSLFPCAWFEYAREVKKTKIININGAGIVEEFRGKGGTAILFAEMYRSLLEGNYHRAELVQVGIENHSMQNELKNIGAVFHKVHRVYEIDL